ncbi:hypothetical protein EVJ58_g1607 [Rhodofomes roseus]|uniref:Uncharacterized protein n=1 Tax=Rhodofomes roseus TaxID=34475 RepID=A0A4Y9Z259_9APHY|nr:hypothetical protein EVJ58_g1607 [Rhodofomes roseus]
MPQPSGSAVPVLPTSQPSAPRPKSHVQSAFDRIRDCPLYLGRPDVLDHIDWEHNPSNGTVIAIERVQDADPDASIVEAQFKLLAQIEGENYYLFVDGGWTDRSVVKDFAKAKRTALLSPGTRHQCIIDNWSVVQANIGKLQEGAKMKNNVKVDGGVPGSILLVPDSDRIRVRHAIFTEKLKTPEPPDNGDFAAHSWKCRSDDVTAKLEEIITSGKYYAHVLPAYDIHDSLIPPDDYEAMLRGALVEIDLAMSYQYFHSNSKHNWWFDIRSIHVVKPPMSMPSSPSKRRATDKVDDPKGKKVVRGH